MIESGSKQASFETVWRIAKALGAFAKMYPVRFGFNGPVPLLQEQNIRNNLCSRVLQKGVVRQTYRA